VRINYRAARGRKPLLPALALHHIKIILVREDYVTPKLESIFYKPGLGQGYYISGAYSAGEPCASSSFSSMCFPGLVRRTCGGLVRSRYGGQAKKSEYLIPLVLSIRYKVSAHCKHTSPLPTYGVLYSASLSLLMNPSPHSFDRLRVKNA